MIHQAFEGRWPQDTHYFMSLSYYFSIIS